MEAPSHLLYCDSHEWIAKGVDPAAVGITDHAQSELGDVVYVELPEVGRVVSAKDSVAVVESVKAASDIYAPVSGEIVEVNAAVAADTSLVNSSPYDQGWLFKIKPSDPSDFDGLMDAASYADMVG